MTILLDTHAFLWFVQNDRQLSATARATIEDANADVLMSVASIWEMAIKYSLGKLNLLDASRSFMGHIDNQLATNDIRVMDISRSHVVGVATLPMRHRDPFDRLLAVQSLQEGIPIVSADSSFDAYGANRIW